MPGHGTRSIRAPAGERPTLHQKPASCGVYPRARRGTVRPPYRATVAAGLSPRPQGNAGLRDIIGDQRRSIPVHAGERVPGGTFECATKVCPRARRGTRDCGILLEINEGLSPRLRGNVSPGGHLSVLRRSVPAPAGERVPGGTFECATKVCPRACGGTARCYRESGLGRFYWTSHPAVPALPSTPRGKVAASCRISGRWPPRRPSIPTPPPDHTSRARGRFLSGYGSRRALRARIRDLRCRPVTRTASSKMVPFFFRPALRYRSLIASKYFLILPRVTPPPGPPEADYLRGKDSLFRNIYYESIREIDRPRKTVLNAAISFALPYWT